VQRFRVLVSEFHLLKSAYETRRADKTSCRDLREWPLGRCPHRIGEAIEQSARAEETVDTKLYLAIAAIVAFLYALAFLLIPVQVSLFFSSFAEPRAILYLRFCGAAVLAWGLIVWFARDFRDWDAVRSVLIATVVGLAVNIVINVWATLEGWLNANAWGSTVVLVLLLLGGAYQLSLGARKPM
jgi:FtsH-binding integral membrane protein